VPELRPVYRDWYRPSIALAMAVDRAENQPEPARLIGWL